MRCPKIFTFGAQNQTFSFRLILAECGRSNAARQTATQGTNLIMLRGAPMSAPERQGLG